MRNRLKTWTRFALPILLVGALAVACGDDDETPTGPGLDELVGTWDASLLTLTWNAMPSVTVDLVGIGATVTLVVNSNGTYSFTVAVPAQPDQVITGDFTLLGGNSFSLTNDAEAGVVWTGTFTLSSDGDELTVNVPNVTIFDFDMDGTEDEALLIGEFDRV
jgi:hypothetical protein